MAWLKKTFLNWWLLTILTALIVAALLLWLLPMVIGPLRPAWVRIGLGILIAAVWGGFAAWRLLSARQASQRLASSLQPPPDPDDVILAKRMHDALATLKAASGDRHDYLFSRPWYVMIGPPGAGKTTALLNCGLRFPFSDTALKGVGGTRNLDFWFADEAVLVDTAGRYTTHDSDKLRDASNWRSFLSLLRKNRPMQPINGVLIAFALDTLTSLSVSELDEHAAILRRRLAELRADLDIEIPVYVVFTKADLVAGFCEFFDDLDVDGRRAVLGATLPADEPAGGGPARLAEAFDELAQSIQLRAAKRLQDELDARRRSLIVAFPAQLSALRSRVVRLVDGAFPPQAQENAPRLRGFYFSSGVQQGAPLDRILSSVAEIYDAPPPAESRGRAYFLNRLLLDVIIPEAGMIRSTARATTRRWLNQTGALAAIAGVTVVILVLWTTSFLQNRGFQRRLEDKATAAKGQLDESGIDLVDVKAEDGSLEDGVAALNALRNLPGGYADQRSRGRPMFMRFGLYQSDEAKRAASAYQQALRRILLPRIFLRLEATMQANQNDPLALYPPLKAYLMLAGQHALEPKVARAWVVANWIGPIYSGPDHAQLRKDLEGHLDALLADPDIAADWPDRQAPWDPTLVQNTRQRILSLPLPDRAYAVLKQQAQSLDQANGHDWRAEDGLDSGAAQAFADPQAVQALVVPSFYTRHGYETVYQIGLQTVEHDLKQDLWVLGEEGAKESVGSQMRDVRAGVASHYAADYASAWDKVVATLRPADYFNNVAAFGALSAPESPVKLLLSKLHENTTFSGGASSAVERGLRNRMPGTVANDLAKGEAGDLQASQLIEAHFRQLNAFTTGQLDDFTTKLKAAVLAYQAAHATGGGLGAGDTQAQLAQAMAALQGAAAAAPAMAQAFTAPASKQGGAAQVSAQQGALSAAYDPKQCTDTADKKYPFFAMDQDAQLGDMVRLFGQNGTLDSLTTGALKPLLVTSGPVWRWSSDPQSASITAAFNPLTAEQLQKARAIRDLMLNGVQPRIEAAGFGGAVTRAEFSTGGHVFDTGQGGQGYFQWNTSALPEARVTLYAGAQKLREYAHDEGPWALFRLFDQAKLQNAGQNAFVATFGEGVDTASFRITLQGDTNPFRRSGIWSFRCPAKL